MDEDDSNITIIEEFDFNSEVNKFNLENNVCKQKDDTKKDINATNSKVFEEVDNLFEEISKKYNLDFGQATTSRTKPKIVNTIETLSDSDESIQSYTDLVNTNKTFKYVKQQSHKETLSDTDDEISNNLQYEEPRHEQKNEKPSINLRDVKLLQKIQTCSDSDESIASYTDLVNMKKTFKYTKQTRKEILSDEEISNDLENKDPIKTQKKLKSDSNSKEAKLLQKAVLQKEREKRKQEAECEKEIKKALLSANKSHKPEECIKLITAIIDTEIMSSSHGTEIGNAMVALGAQFKIQTQIMPNTVTWIRKLQTHLIGNDGKLTLSTADTEEQQMLLILSWKEVIQLVNQNALVTYVNSIQSVFGNKRISLGIYGIEKYFRHFKNQKKNEVHSDVSGTVRNSKTNKEFSDVAKVSRRELEFALTELQLLCSCCYRFLETAHDVGAMIAQFTKSIAQAPYKLEKNEQHQQSEWYMSGDNKDCVRVDKDGNGLQRLWQQQLTSFPLARIETAEAIIAKYPTVTSLMEAYDECENSIECDQLLQDLPIRRAAGPLTANRKIGPELSKRVNIFFTSVNGEINL